MPDFVESLLLKMNQDRERVRSLVENIVKEFVDHPDDARVELVDKFDYDIIRIHVHPNDVGMLVGKKGINMRAIGQIIYVMAGKQKRKYVLEKVE